VSAPANIRQLIAAQRRAQSGRLQLAAVAAAVVSVAAVGLLGLSGWFITGAAFAGVAGLVAVQAFNYMMPSAIIRLLAILRTGARYVERVSGHEAALKALARLRPQLFDAIASGSAERALSLSSGEVSARLVQDVDAVQILFVRRSAPWGLGAGAATAVVLAALATPLAGLALFFAMGLACIGGLVLARWLADPAGRAAQTAVGALKDRLSALEAAAPELKAYDLDDWAIAESIQAAAAYDEAQVALVRAGGWIAAWQTLATAIAVAAVVPATSGAPLAMTALAVLAAVMGVESAGGLIGALHQNGGAVEALQRLDAMTPPPDEASVGKPEGETLRWRTLDLETTPPFRLGLYGPSGAGKTTLIERTMGLREALHDEVFIGATDAADIAGRDRRALFAYAAQDVRLLDGTIRQNLLMAGPADDDTLWRALDDAVLGDRIRAEPLGLDAHVGANGERLSGGERRRLGLARAYLRDAPWLVLDEPTAGLDPVTENRVLVALQRRLSEREQGLIVISHKPHPMGLCDQRIHVKGIDAQGHVHLSVTSNNTPGESPQATGINKPHLLERQHLDQAE
jgi:ATP-binding cassette subfamily C protein CydC